MLALYVAIELPGNDGNCETEKDPTKGQTRRIKKIPGRGAVTVSL
jgi:hypothetical protein